MGKRKDDKNLFDFKDLMAFGIEKPPQNFGQWRGGISISYKVNPLCGRCPS